MFTVGHPAAEFTVRRVTEQRILIRGAKQVVTLQGPARMRVGKELEDPAVLRDASVLIEQGRIVQIGGTRRLENLRSASSPRWVDARNLVVIPGFVDSVNDLNPHLMDTGMGAASSDRGPGGGLLSRRITREVQRLALAGSTFVRAGISYPGDPGERGRTLRQLLRVDLPPASYQAGLRIDAHTMRSDPIPNLTLRNLLPVPSRQHLRELTPLLTMELDGELLRSMDSARRLQLVRSASQTAHCLVSGADAWTASELLDLSLVVRFQAEGALPGDPATVGQLAHWGFPWLARAGRDALRGDPWIDRIKKAVDEGLALGLATGYSRERAGVLSPLALLALMRERTGLDAGKLLQLQIANTAHSLGVGDRMGSLEAGKEANLLLVDCEDYRELGLQVGAPRVVAVYRRGQLVREAETH